MKLKVLIFILLLALCPAGYAAEKSQVPASPGAPRATGTDWLLMTPQEKVACINQTITFLKAKGIPIERPAGYYGAAMNEVADQKGAEKAYVADLVTTLVFKAEPQTRPIISQLRVKPGTKAPAPAKKTPVKKQII